MSRKKKTAIILAGLLLVYALAGFMIIPLVLESILPDKLSETLHRPVTVENIRLNPFALTAAVEGLDIRDKNASDPFAAFDELFVNIQTLSLFKLGLVAKEVRLVRPDIHIVRTGQTEFNFSDLLPEKDPDAPPDPPAESPEHDKKPFQFSISNIAIVDGRIGFQDTVVDKSHELSAINFTLPHIANFKEHVDTYSEPLLTGDFNQAGLSFDLDTRPFHDSLETIVDVSVSGLAIDHYFAYVPENMVGFEITDGRLDLAAHLSFRAMPEKSDLTVEGTVGLAGLEITDRAGNKIFSLPGLKIDVAPCRPLENELTLAGVTIDAPQLSVVRNSQGIINLTTLGPEPSEEQAPTESDTASAGADQDETKSSEKNSASPADESPAETPFIISISDLALDSGKILFTDFAALSSAGSKPAEISLDDLMIHITDFTTAPDKTAQVEIAARVNQEAAIRAAGQAGVTPLWVDADFSVADLALAWGQPYIPENVHLIVADGKFSASGHATVETDENANLHTTVAGQAAIKAFASMDSVRNQDFIAWDTFSLDGIDVSINPLKINTEKILLAGFKNQLMVFKDGTTNLEAIFPKTASAEEAPADPAEKTGETTEETTATAVVPIKIGEVALDNFDFRFIDKNIEPNYSTHLNLSELRITGLTSENFESADLVAEGKIDDYAPVTINGKLNPLKEDLFLDVTYSLANMELSPLSPYTGKYIGQTIQKGKLSTRVEYTIDQKALSAKNHLLLDQFTLGQTVDSPDALKLPVGLAVALLKDRKGQINVDLPISGRTDDPEFGIGKPLLKALQNLIVKAATSPFALVGSLVGGGEELRFIEFAPGSTAITPDAAKKLDAIGKLMYERPALNLDISGYVDPAADRSALTALALERKIKAETLKKDAPKDPATLDSISLAPEKYLDLLKQTYAKEILSTAKDKKSLKPLKDPTLTAEEMETLLREQIAIPDAELRLLALERAKQVKGYVLEQQSVSADRLFLAEPETLSPGETEKFIASRVELNVR